MHVSEAGGMLQEHQFPAQTGPIIRVSQVSRSLFGTFIQWQELANKARTVEKGAVSLRILCNVRFNRTWSQLTRKPSVVGGLGAGQAGVDRVPGQGCMHARRRSCMQARVPQILIAHLQTTGNFWSPGCKGNGGSLPAGGSLVYWEERSLRVRLKF